MVLQIPSSAHAREASVTETHSLSSWKEGQGNFITRPVAIDLFLKRNSFLSNSHFLVFSEVQFQAFEGEGRFLTFSFSGSVQEQSVPQQLPVIWVKSHFFATVLHGASEIKDISGSGCFQASELGFHEKERKRPG